MSTSDNTAKILEERGKTYGEYRAVSATFNAFMLSVDNARSKLTSAQYTSLTMITMKLSRILNGDPNHIDSWRDIAGYAELAIQEIEK